MIGRSLDDAARRNDKPLDACALDTKENSEPIMSKEWDGHARL